MVRLSTVGAGVVLLAVAFGLTPVTLHYATSDSMEPAIAEGDIFLVYHTENVEEGDVALFRSATRDGRVAHRIVGRTDGGFVTKGDANPSTDQAGGAPPVPRDSVIGRVVTVGGSPLTVSGLGRVAALVAANRVAIGAALLLLFVAVATAEREDDRSARSNLRTPPELFRPFFAMAIGLSLLVVFLGAATAPVAFVHTDDPAVAASSPLAVETGESTTATIPVETNKPPMAVHIARAGGEFELVGYEETPTGVDVTVRVPPKAEVGSTPGEVSVYSYPAVLPRETIVALHHVHPLAAALATALVVVTPVALLYLLLFDPREVFRERLREVGR